MRGSTRAVVEQIDWDCEVHHHYSAINMGPRRWLSSGISRAFELYERAAELAIWGRHWRNRFMQKGPRWLINGGMKAVRWLEQQRSRLVAR